MSAAAGYAGRHKERAEALQRAAAGTRRRSAPTSLSSHLAQQPGCYDGRKIAAVDKSIESLDSLPDRYAGVKTLYLSKNALRSLAGVEQFRELKALSAADNMLADLDCLYVLPAAGIALEAASFEGNPLADLPNYRAHVIHILGPSLAVLDNRPVSAEERAAAPGAVAHEATMLALMLSNACLVHKLGRAVQLVRLHCELQCAVLGGQYASAGAGSVRDGASGADGGVMASRRGINRVLQLWDYEASLGRQERHAIMLAIRREVGRRYRKILLAGGKPEGSSKLWQQAFAQVMLQQQETIASLMCMLEAAKAETAASLAPLTRPPSPAKRAALESEAEAQGRIRQDREALIQELRDAFLGLAESSTHTNAPQQAAHFEARIRELHAALEAASNSPAPGTTPASGAAPSEQWAITAVRPLASPQASPRSATSSPRQQQQQPFLRRPISSVLKSALKQPRPESSCGWSPARPGASQGAAAPAASAVSGAERTARPPSARPACVAVPPHAQPGAPPQPYPAPIAGQQQEQGSAQGMDAAQPQRHPWQADDALAEYESMEQARCKTPRPFQASSEPHSPGFSRAASAPASSDVSPPREYGVHYVQLAVSTGMPAGQLQHSHGQPSSVPSRPASAAMAGSPPPSRPASPGWPHDANPSQWTPNPLARTSTSGAGSKSPPGSGSPRRQGLQAVFRILEREGRVTQVEALKSAVAQYETTAAELQAGNHELAEALQQVQQHAQALEAKLAAQRQAAQGQQAAAEAELASMRLAVQEHQAQAAAQLAEDQGAQQQQLQQLGELERKLEEALAARSALQAQLEAASEQQQRLLQAAVAERLAAEEEQERQRASFATLEQQLLARVAEVEARKAVHLGLTVQSHEEEWRAEAARAAALEARVADLSACIAAYQQQERLQAASAQLAARAVQRRVLMRWRQATATSAYLAAMQHQAEAMHRRSLLATWLSAWRLATHRSRLLAELEAQRQRHRLLTAWHAWKLYCQDCIIHRGQHAQAELHRQDALMRKFFAAWQSKTASVQQVEWPDSHPTLRIAAQMQRRRLLRSCFSAWRQHISEVVLPRLAAVQLRVLEQFMGSQRRAFAAWQQYLQRRRELRLLKAAAQQHFLKRCLFHWRQAAQESKQARAATMYAALTSDQLLMRRGWRAWRAAVQQHRQQVEGNALAEQHLRHKLLVQCWAKWQEWTVLCRGLNQRRAARLQAEAFGAWRLAAKAAERRRLADAFSQRRCRRHFRVVLAAWRQAAAARRLRRHQLAHAQAQLQRRMLGRVIAGWQRATLAGKLYQALDVVQHLQSAVGRMREELDLKAEEIDELNSVHVTVEGASESLQVQVCSLDADLAAAQRQADELQAAAHAAQVEHEAAAAALEQALAAQAAAEAECASAAEERDAALTARKGAEAERSAACCAQQEAERQAAEAERRADTAAMAAAAAKAQAAAAAVELEELTQERQVLASQLAALQAERRDLVAQLEAVQGEARQAAAALERLEGERDRLRCQREQAEQAALSAAAEQQAALKQAERLTQMCEEQQQQCRRLQQQVAQLQGSLESQSALQAELAQLAACKEQLQADNQSMQAQLDHFAAAVQRAEGDTASLQQALEASAAEQRRLQERCRAAEAEAHRHERLVSSLQAAQSALEAQLAQAQAEAAQAAAKQGELAAAVEALTAERDGLATGAATCEALWGSERAALEATAEQLRGQLLASNEVLESCRRMLGETCSARNVADQQAASLTELLRSVKAELLLKDAAIKSLTRENAQRAERLRALQAQVAALSRAGPSEQPHPVGLPAVSPRGSAPMSTPASYGSPWLASGSARYPAPAAPNVAPSGSAAGLQPAAALPAEATPAGSSLQAAALPSWGVAPGGAVGTAAAAGVASSTQLHNPQFGTAAGASRQPYQHPQQFTTPSPVPLSVPIATWCQGQHGSGGPPHGAASTTITISSSAAADRSGSRVAAPGSPAASKATSGDGSGTTSATSAASLSQLLAPLCSASASGLLPPGLSEEQLAYLLELVVAKRISAAQAQQVINAAADGDAQPLLRLLSDVQQQIEQGSSSRGSSSSHSSSLPRHARANHSSPMEQGTVSVASPATAAELAAVRQILKVTVEQRQAPGRAAARGY